MREFEPSEELESSSPPKSSRVQALGSERVTESERSSPRERASARVRALGRSRVRALERVQVQALKRAPEFERSGEPSGQLESSSPRGNNQLVEFQFPLGGWPLSRWRYGPYTVKLGGPYPVEAETTKLKLGS